LAEEIEECGADLADTGHRFEPSKEAGARSPRSNNELNGGVKHPSCGVPTTMRNGRIRREPVPNSTTGVAEMV
ncbi:MAG TPA: hypothetical protein VHP35_09015, partial [Terriglobia bacterium]|nr:hypothetical protein [Terriglobia bacterium]